MTRGYPPTKIEPLQPLLRPAAELSAPATSPIFSSNNQDVKGALSRAPQGSGYTDRPQQATKFGTAGASVYDTALLDMATVSRNPSQDQLNKVLYNYSGPVAPAGSKIAEDRNQSKLVG